MASKRKPQPKDNEAKVHPLVWDLTGQILARLGDMTKEAFAKKAKRSVSTFYGWRNGERQSPRVLELEDFAAVVGLHVGLLGQDAPVTKPEGALDPITKEIVRLIQQFLETDEAKLSAKAAVEKAIKERASRPPEAVVEEEGHRDRKTKSK